MPIPAVAASFSVPPSEAVRTVGEPSESNHVRKYSKGCLDKRLVQSCAGDQSDGGDGGKCGLARSSSLHSRRDHSAHESIMAASKSGKKDILHIWIIWWCEECSYPQTAVIYIPHDCAGEQICSSVEQAGAGSTILTQSTCSLHSDTHTSASQSLSIHSKGEQINMKICNLFTILF